MKLPRRRFLHLAAGAAALIALTNTTLAQDWPIRPVTMVYPFVAGSAADVLGRLFASRLSELLGQTVVFENVGGAGGMIGSNRVAKAAPDGYQFVLGGTFMVLNQALYKNRSEPGTSFAHAEKPRGTRLCPSYFARWYHGAAAARARAGARATNRFVRLALPGSEPRRQPAGPAALSPRSQREPASAGAIRTIAELQLSPCHRRWKHRLRFHQRRAAQEGAVHDQSQAGSKSGRHSPRHFPTA